MSLRLLRRKERAPPLAQDGDAAGAPLVVSGDVRIDGGAAFPSGLVARGDMTVGAGARVQGSVRVEGTLVLEQGARLDGDATVAGDAVVAPGARVTGRLACRRLRLGTVVHVKPKGPAEEAASEAALAG